MKLSGYLGKQPFKPNDTNTWQNNDKTGLIDTETWEHIVAIPVLRCMWF